MTRLIIERPAITEALIMAKRKRVCAYVRVSTGHEAQLDSLENQTQYYTKKISSRYDYEFVGIFSDAGISGAKEGRPAFQQIMDLSRKGKIDLILTKSLSRFARNTVLLLKSVRELKSLGVAVEFEKEQINTLTSEGEFLLSILASVAEEERKSVSSNIKWSVQNRYKRGDAMINAKRLLGYDKDENGELMINEEQAIIVRQIYKRYLERVPGYQIAKELNAEGVPTFARKEWSFTRILSIISNEKYAGDCLMQKHYMSSAGKQVTNRGQLAQYFVKDDHPGIVNRNDWNTAQQIRKERVRKTYAWSSLLRCPLCGANLIRVTSEWGCNWTCGTYMHRGKTFCVGIRVPEKYLIGLCFTEPMVVEEIHDEERTKSYRFTPAASFHR